MTRFTLDRFFRYLFIAGVMAAGVWFVWYFDDLVLYLLVGLVLSYVMTPVVNWLQGLLGSRVSAIMLTFMVVLGGLGFLMVLLVPFAGRQLTELTHMLSVEKIVAATRDVEDAIRAYNIPLERDALVERVRELEATLFRSESWMSRFTSALSIFTDIFYGLVVVPFVTFFFLKDGPLIREGLLRLVPNRYFELTLAIVDKVEQNIGRYFRALLQQCLAVASVATVTLWIAGVDSALAVGIFTGLANTIPYFGPAMGLIVGAGVGVVQTGDFSLLPGIAFAMLITQLMDNFLFQPFLFSRAASTHPLVILCVVLIGAKLAGLPGMLLAIPVLTVVRVLLVQVMWSLRNYRIFRLT